jgi:hypothetical protein
MKDTIFLQLQILMTLNKYGALPIDMLANNLYKRVPSKSAITRTKRLMKKLIDTGSIIFHQCPVPQRPFVTITESGANRLGCYHVRDILVTKDQMPSDLQNWCNMVTMQIIENHYLTGRTFVYSQKEILTGRVPFCRFGFRAPDVLDVETCYSDEYEGRVYSYATWIEIIESELDDGDMTSLVEWIIYGIDMQKQRLFFPDRAEPDWSPWPSLEANPTGYISLRSMRFVLIESQAELLPTRLYNELIKRIGVESTKKVSKYLQFYIPGKPLQFGFDM